MRDPDAPLYIYEIQGEARDVFPPGTPHLLGVWPEGDCSFVFFGAEYDALVAERLTHAPGLKLLATHRLTHGQWADGNQVEPMEAGDLIIAPPGVKTVPAPGKHLIRLDAGLVFGSGLHPTTAGCLELIQTRASEGPMEGFLDLGAGTGILALAAASMGASPVWAVDLNPMCVEAARNNALLNNLDITVFEGDALRFLHLPAQMVAANLSWEVLSRLLAEPERLVGVEDLILSGILAGAAEGLKTKLETCNFCIKEERSTESGWYCCLAKQQI